MGATHIHDLALILEDLERNGRIARISSSVDLNHDLAGLAAELEGSPRAVLFENIKGNEWPVLTGLYWSRDLLADLMRCEEKVLPQYVSDCIKSWRQSPVDPVVIDNGPVLDVTETDVDMTRMPIPVHAEKDGGPYFDAGVVVAKDPETGVRNASIQRFQVVAKDRLHVNIDTGRHLELYLDKAEKQGKTLTFTLNCGVGPGLHFAAAAPAEAAPPDSDELGIASAFHEAPLELVKASNGYDDMVAHAMWALECEIVPGEVADEGPFAEVTGYYATVAPRPVVHVRKIHRRANPVFHSILSGVEVWNSVGLLGEANILQLMQKQVPGITDVYMSHGGGGFYHCVVQIAQKRQGWSKQAILAAFAAFPPLKMVTIVDDDVNLRSAQDVEWAMATRMNPKKDIVTIDEAFGHGLNPSFPDYLGPKVGFDATKPYPPTWAYERAIYKPMTLEAVEMIQPEIVRRATATTSTQPGYSRADVEAFEADLARPQPADLTPVGASGKAASPATLHAEAGDDLVRPQPIDLTPVRSAAGDSQQVDDDDAWIARPAAIDLTPRTVPTAAATTNRDEDPDAWIAISQPIDLTSRRAAAQPAGIEAQSDPDAWIIRPTPADLTPVASMSAQSAAPEKETAAEDPDAWIARPVAADLTPVNASLKPEDSSSLANEPADGATDDADAWIARPMAADLASVHAAAPPDPVVSVAKQTTTAPEPEEESRVEAVAGDMAPQTEGNEVPEAVVEAASSEPDAPTPAVDKQAPEAENPTAVAARPTAFAEPPASRPVRQWPTTPPPRKISRSPVSGGSFFEPASELASESSAGGGITEAAEEAPKKLVVSTRTNRDKLLRKIQPVSLLVSDTGDVVRTSGFFDSIPMPAKPVRKIARSIAKVAGSPKLKKVIKPAKSGDFFSDD